MIFLQSLSWYLMIALVGWLAFPLAYRLLRFLPDRGLALARPLGLLLWGYVYWLLVSLHVLQNDAGGILFALLVVAAISASLLRKGGLAEIGHWLRENSRLVWVVELVFLLAFAVWVVFRAAMPDASGTEKPMELAFINAILRSPTFPPSDPWLSGYAISYYYFGYVMVAMLAGVTSIPGAVAFNLGVASWFALTGLAAFGLLYNLLALRKRPGQPLNPLSGLFAPLFVLVAGNLEGFLEMLHARGIFWKIGVSGMWESGFWSWLDIQELTQAPNQPFTWTPNRPAGIWWWRASRVLQDYAADGSTREVIDEFPMFSFLLGDLHPHVLAMPFALLALGLALNTFLQIRAAGSPFNVEKWLLRLDFWFTALVLGGLAFLNTWDFPIYLALFAAAAVLAGILKKGWRFEAVSDFLFLIVSLGMAGGILYLPFYLTFSSQANGLLPSLVFFTRGAHFWVMFGGLLLPVVAWMAWTWKRRDSLPRLGQGLLFAAALLGGLWLLSALYAVLRLGSDPSLSGIWGAVSSQGLVAASVLDRFLSPWTWLTLLALLTLAWGLLQATLVQGKEHIFQGMDQTAAQSSPAEISDLFVVLVFLLGTGLVLFPEFFYLRDQFGFRMNTIFKFYFQAWILWGISAGYASAVLLSELRGSWRAAFMTALTGLVLISLPYGVFGILSRTNGLNPSMWSLDGSAYIQNYDVDEIEGIRWLQQAPYGIVAEAVGGSYTGYARISTHTGLPTVLGWPGHESQWRGGAAEMGTREADITRLFRAKDWAQASEIMQKYHIRYLYIGQTERRDFRPDEGLFSANMPVVFKKNGVIIFEYQVSDTQQEQALNP